MNKKRKEYNFAGIIVIIFGVLGILLTLYVLLFAEEAERIAYGVIGGCLFIIYWFIEAISKEEKCKCHG